MCNEIVLQQSIVKPLRYNKIHMDPVPEIVQKQSKHDGLRYGCDQCDYNATKMEALKVTNIPYTKAWRMAVTSTIMKLHEKVHLKKH